MQELQWRVLSLQQLELQFKISQKEQLYQCHLKAREYQKQKRFITDASHELKTPLTIIDANTEVIELTTGENEQTISTRNQVKRLASLTEKLVMLSRMDEENTTLERQNFCISDAVYDTAEIKSYRYTIQQMIFLLEIWTYCLNAFTGLMNLVILRREVLELDFLSLQLS